MQRQAFSDGGFVIHRIPHGNARISAWYDGDGRLLDAELIRNGRGRTVTNNHVRIIDRLEMIGRIHK